MAKIPEVRQLAGFAIFTVNGKTSRMLQNGGPLRIRIFYNI